MTLNRSSKIQNKKLLCLIWCIEHKLVTVGCRTVLAVNTRTRCLVCPRIHITYAIKSHFDFSQRWAERNSVSLGLMHGCDTWLHQIPQRGHNKLGECVIIKEDVLFSIPDDYSWQKGQCQGYCFVFLFLILDKLLGLSTESKLLSILLGRFIIDMDAGSTTPNNGLP